MASRSSSRKISPSRWRSPLRRRRRREQTPPRQLKNSRRTIRRLSKPAVVIPPAPWYMQAARLSIVLLGSGAILGTALSWMQAQQPVANVPAVRKPAAAPLASLALGKPNAALQQKIQSIAAKYPALGLHLMVKNLANGEYVDLQASKAIAAASTIKIPIAMALLQQVDLGKIKLDEQLVLKKSMIAGGAGRMSSLPIGSKVTVREALQAAITISDNTATNLLIERLGGQEQINLQWRSWGLVTTTLNSPLPDFAGTNQVNGRELAMVLQHLEKGALLSPTSRQTALEIFRQTKRNHLLPAGVGDNRAKIAHKTGELNKILADAGLVELANGQKYLVVALVQRPENDQRAAELIRQVAAAITAS